MIPRGSRKSSAADEGSDWEQEMAAASGSQPFHWVLCLTDKQPRPENT